MLRLSVLLLLAISGFSSCRTALCGTIHAVPAPSVVLKNGQNINASTVSYSFYENKEGHLGRIKYFSELYKPRILVNDSSYKFKDVYAFSDGDRSFVDIGNGNFAFRCGDGKINTYASLHLHADFTNAVHHSEETFDLTRGIGGTGQKCVTSIPVRSAKGKTIYPHAHFYIQQGDTGSVQSFKYRNLIKMIPDNTHPYYYLVKYRRTKIIAPIATVGGICMMIAGANYSATAHGNSSADKRIAAVSSIIGYSGFAISLGSLYTYCNNHLKLTKALYAYNGE